MWFKYRHAPKTKSRLTREVVFHVGICTSVFILRKRAPIAGGRAPSAVSWTVFAATTPAEEFHTSVSAPPGIALLAPHAVQDLLEDPYCSLYEPGLLSCRGEGRIQSAYRSYPVLFSTFRC